MKAPTALLREVGGWFDAALGMWELIGEGVEFMNASKATAWSDVDPGRLEEDAKALSKRVKQLHKGVRWCPAYKELDKRVRDFASTCPLILALRHPSMRNRHWKALMVATGKEFTPPDEDPDLKLAGLLDLKLHEFGADVEDIADKAQKELKMEETLKKLDDVWGTVSFAMAPYKATAVPLLSMGEEDFEMLETDQLAVQAMVASRYVAQFREQVDAWQARLAVVGDVVMLLGELQRTWAFLEPLFVGSEEVRKELPDAAARFTKLDVSVRATLAAAWEDRVVTTACARVGLPARLRGIGDDLELCKKALADFMDSKRRVFPRFYFVSEADLLDILANGSEPRNILRHVDKVYLATAELRLDGSGKRAVQFVAGVGVEVLDFAPPVELEGKPERYLQTVRPLTRRD